ncbi:hypothetical protein [Hymenobacter sp. BT730]|uniref:hypothetical protein n=1 Tax=Hymenobacter sp. BT730 TaxID=3063332 RepID=UPI0026E10D77|nr:hypothetical protein [Hymenobacter sp. BT730]
MLRLVLFLGLLTGIAHSSWSQTPADSIIRSAQPAAAAATYTHADTLRAIQAIYLKHRRSARVMLGLTPVLAVGTAYSVLSEWDFGPSWHSSGGGTDNPQTSSIIKIVVGTISTGVLGYVALNASARNSRVSEREMVLIYEQKHELPRRMQRQLPRQLAKLR